MSTDVSIGTGAQSSSVGRGFHPGWTAAVLAIAGLLGGVVMGVHFATDIDVNLLLADPAELVSLPAYTGAYTYIGAVALFAALAICLFTASVTKTDDGGPIGTSFLVSLGVLAAWLGLDDLFMFHEWAGLAIAETAGMDDAGARSRLEGVVFGAYGLAWLAWIGMFRQTIRHTSFILLLLALGCLAASIAVDVGMFLFPRIIPDTPWMPTTLAVAEEMLKLTGILFLLAYAVDASRRALGNVFERRLPAAYGR